MTEPRIAPYGTWASPISTDLITGAAIGLGDVAVDGDDIYWLESRPTEAGRLVLVSRSTSTFLISKDQADRRDWPRGVPPRPARSGPAVAAALLRLRSPRVLDSRFLIPVPFAPPPAERCPREEGRRCSERAPEAGSCPS